jgi:hypothetical protein
MWTSNKICEMLELIILRELYLRLKNVISKLNREREPLLTGCDVVMAAPLNYTAIQFHSSLLYQGSERLPR